MMKKFLTLLFIFSMVHGASEVKKESNGIKISRSASFLTALTTAACYASTLRLDPAEEVSGLSLSLMTIGLPFVAYYFYKSVKAKKNEKITLSRPEAFAVAGAGLLSTAMWWPKVTINSKITRFGNEIFNLKFFDDGRIIPGMFSLGICGYFLYKALCEKGEKIDSLKST